MEELLIESVSKLGAKILIISDAKLCPLGMEELLVESVSKLGAKILIISEANSVP
jgi:hypothetical protein